MFYSLIYFMQSNVLLVKIASEVSLKSEQVRRFFEKKLCQNILETLQNNGIIVNAIEIGRGRLFVYSKELEKSAELLKFVFGIHSIALAIEKEYSSLEEFLETASKISLEQLNENDSFGFFVKRATKKFVSSQEIEKQLAEKALQKISSLKVNLKNPEKKFFVELFEKKFAIYFSETECLNGLPIGVSGKIGFVFEGLKNEKQACLKLMKRGCQIFPVIKKDSEKTQKAIKELIPFNCFREFKQQSLDSANIDFFDAIGTAEQHSDGMENFFRKKIVLRPLLLELEE